jgi:hypothetical protein
MVEELADVLCPVLQEPYPVALERVLEVLREVVGVCTAIMQALGQVAEVVTPVSKAAITMAAEVEGTVL